jgi:curved DNA-binding protein CbpA
MLYKILKRTFCEYKITKEFLNKDYYSLLKLKPGASENEIRKSYYLLAKRYHPDKYKGPVEIFRKLTEAYNTLKDAGKRELYNIKLKIKIRKTETPNNERKTSLYEDDFKKLNIDKLYYQFDKKKFRLQPDELKIFKPVLEKKMSRREYILNEFFNSLREDESKAKSLKHIAYKKAGYIKEDEPIRPYDELVKEEMEKIKNKQTVKEEVKKQQEDSEKQEKVENKQIITLLYYITGFYVVSMFTLLVIHYLRKRKLKEIMLKNIELKDKERLRKYQFFG